MKNFDIAASMSMTKETRESMLSWLTDISSIVHDDMNSDRNCGRNESFELEQLVSIIREMFYDEVTVIITSSGAEANAIALKQKSSWSGTKDSHFSVIKDLKDNSLNFTYPLISNISGSINTHVRTSGQYIHVDACQALGKLPLNNVDFDSMSISAHKIGGPKGIGALIIKNKKDFSPLINGYQQDCLRGGTISPLLCAGFTSALKQMNVKDDAVRLKSRRNIITSMIPVYLGKDMIDLNKGDNFYDGILILGGFKDAKKMVSDMEKAGYKVTTRKEIDSYFNQRENSTIRLSFSSAYEPNIFSDVAFKLATLNK